MLDVVLKWWRQSHSVTAVFFAIGIIELVRSELHHSSTAAALGAVALWLGYERHLEHSVPAKLSIVIDGVECHSESIPGKQV